MAALPRSVAERGRHLRIRRRCPNGRPSREGSNSRQRLRRSTATSLLARSPAKERHCRAHSPPNRTRCDLSSSYTLDGACRMVPWITSSAPKCHLSMTVVVEMTGVGESSGNRVNNRRFSRCTPVDYLGYSEYPGTQERECDGYDREGGNGLFSSAATGATIGLDTRHDHLVRARNGARPRCRRRRGRRVHLHDRSRRRRDRASAGARHPRTCHRPGRRPHRAALAEGVVGPPLRRARRPDRTRAVSA